MAENSQSIHLRAPAKLHMLVTASQTQRETVLKKSYSIQNKPKTYSFISWIPLSFTKLTVETWFDVPLTSQLSCDLPTRDPRYLAVGHTNLALISHLILCILCTICYMPKWNKSLIIIITIIIIVIIDGNNPYLRWPRVSPGIIRYSFTNLGRMEDLVDLAVRGHREICWYDLHEDLSRFEPGSLAW